MYVVLRCSYPATNPNPGVTPWERQPPFLIRVYQGDMTLTPLTPPELLPPKSSNSSAAVGWAPIGHGSSIHGYGPLG